MRFSVGAHPIAITSDAPRQIHTTCPMVRVVDIVVPWVGRRGRLPRLGGADCDRARESRSEWAPLAYGRAGRTI